MKIMGARNLNKFHPFPIINIYKQKRNINYSLNNISSTTNASILINSPNNSEFLSNRNLISLKKIKINNNNYSQRSINNSEINSSNIKKKTIKILNRADKILKERVKYKNLRKNLIKSLALKASREISLKNYSINLLKERLIKLNEKKIIIDKNLKNFSVQYEKSNNKIKNFFEEIKTNTK